MRVRALQGFTDERGSHQPGDEWEMEDGLAGLRSRSGLVVPVSKEPGMATTPEPEKAVSRGRKPVTRRKRV